MSSVGRTACHSAQDAINVLAALGVAEGTSETTFEPLSNLRRDQMASFINRAQGAIQAASGGDAAGFTTEDSYFPDTEGNLHDDNIDGIASQGIVQGRTDGNYYPADPVNRGQMSAFIMRWVQVLENSGLAEGEGEGFLSEDGTPLQVGEGSALEVRSLEGLDAAGLQGIVDLLEDLLGGVLDEGLLGEDGILGVEDLLGGGLVG